MMIKDIPGYEGRYEISEYGDIINNKSHILSPAIGNSGYLRVCLETGVPGKRKNESVHRLVAKTFIPNPDNLPVVMHMDDNKLNNHVTNLQWGTQSDNIKQAFSKGRKTTPNKPHLIKPVNKKPSYEVYNEETGDSIVFRTTQECGEAIDFKPHSISMLVHRNTKISQGPYKGYKVRKIMYSHILRSTTIP